MPQPPKPQSAGPNSHSPKAVLLMSSLVARGRVGLRAQAFALERLGFEPWLVPTVVLPFHPGHGKATRIIPELAEFEAMLGDLKTQTDLTEIAAVITGYLPNADLAEPVADIIAAVRSANPNVLVVIDPVIGDERGLYVAEATANAIRGTLLPLADLATPNRFELAWLAGSGIDDNQACSNAAKALGLVKSLVTSAHPLMRNSAANLLIDGDNTILAETPAIPAVPHGPGDLTSALMAANLLRGFSPEKALNRTTGAVHEVLAASAKLGTDELALVAAQPFLDRPRMPVSMRTLAGQGSTSRSRGRLTPSSLT